MGKRHEKLGIKQTVQKHWMDKTVQMMLAGLTEKDIRAELDAYMSTQKQSGGIGLRGEKTYGMAISLLASWFAPSRELIPIRDDVLEIARRLPTSEWMPLHWIILTASYPFWFNVARQIGRLFNLQDQITQAQVFNRLKEQYGDRETVARNARYTVRSFVAWGVLKDSETNGCYEKNPPICIIDADLAILMFESALLATPEAKVALGLLQNNPAFFPFHLPVISGDSVTQRSNRIDIVRYGLDDQLLMLKQ
ncbi:MAG: hypothetical protein PHY54_18915 [Methylococcales bacterium]|nr:hypothetical protein [Methylococcales bacterium]